jgi:MFS family permease
MKFPQDLLRFLYWIFFKPISLHTQINQLDPGIGNVATLLTRSYDQSAQSLKNLALFYILIMPWLLGLGTGILLSGLGMDVNWLKLTFYLFVAIALSLTFNIHFCIAFLLPFSIAVAIWSSNAFTPVLGILFSLMLGLAYGLASDSARWGLIAGLIYSVFLGFVLGPRSGLNIGTAFLIGYFRIVFYLVEAPLSWILGTLADRENALRLWQFHPVLWDELIWFRLPRLDKHLLAIQRQDEPAAQAAILHVQESFRQRWAAERIL